MQVVVTRFQVTLLLLHLILLLAKLVVALRVSWLLPHVLWWQAKTSSTTRSLALLSLDTALTIGHILVVQLAIGPLVVVLRHPLLISES